MTVKVKNVKVQVSVNRGHVNNKTCGNLKVLKRANLHEGKNGRKCAKDRRC